MTALVTNNAYSLLAADFLTANTTSFTVTTGEGSRFPAPTGGNYALVTLVDASNNVEIVKYTSRSGDTFSGITRGQDGTSARDFVTGCKIELRFCAALYTPAAMGAAPTTSGTALLKGDGSGGTTAASAGTDYEAAISKSTGYAKWSGSAWTFANETYALSTHNHSGTYEPVISAGTTGQYWRGDKTWQTLDKSAVGLSGVENTALSTWPGSANIVTVGTVAGGTWNATAIAAGKGGTGWDSSAATGIPKVTAGTWSTATAGTDYVTPTGTTTLTNKTLTSPILTDPVVGTAALATNATTGFPWIPSMPGTPTGAPSLPYTNAMPLVVDSTNSRLYTQIAGQWRGVSIGGVDGPFDSQRVIGNFTPSANATDWYRLVESVFIDNLQHVRFVLSNAYGSFLVEFSVTKKFAVAKIKLIGGNSQNLKYWPLDWRISTNNSDVVNLEVRFSGYTSGTTVQYLYLLEEMNHAYSSPTFPLSNVGTASPTYWVGVRIGTNSTVNYAEAKFHTSFNGLSGNGAYCFEALADYARTAGTITQGTLQT